MNLFHLHAEKEQNSTRAPRTWLVIAESLFEEAIAFVPEDFSVKAIKVQVGTVSGPRRVVGGTRSPSIH